MPVPSLLPPESPPLLLEAEGTIRVGKSRVTLDVIVEQYENGMTPEELVRAYDTLELADAYAAIAYYLTHRDAVLDYLKRRGREAKDLRARVEAGRPSVSRDELLARRDRVTDHAPARH
jgi:uncharacterized protein (DUF433 family)